MSATLYLYKVLPDVKYLGTEFDKLDKKLVKRLLNNDLDLYLKLKEDNIFEYKFSDGKQHELIDVTTLKIYAKNANWSRKSSRKGYLRMARKLEPFVNSIVCTTYGMTYHYIVVDQICYRQGWFLKDSWLNGNCTFYFATTKEQMMNFFKKHIDLYGKDKRGLDCIYDFENAWEDGMIFKASF